VDRPTRPDPVGAAALVLAAALTATAVWSVATQPGSSTSVPARRTDAGAAASPSATPAPSATPSAFAAPSATPSPSPSEDPPLTSVIHELTEFVEDNRELEFKRPVTVTALTDDAFRERIRSWYSGGARQGDQDLANLWQALGFVPADTDLGALAEEFTEESLQGYYDPTSEELVIRGKRATPYARGVLAHELTHALQDQHFGLDRKPTSHANDESAIAFSALVEGDAELVRGDYYETLSSAEQRRHDEEEGTGTPDGVPAALLGFEGFAYDAGTDFVLEIYERGGMAAVDKAFRTPPTTSEQVLHPERFLRRDVPPKLLEPYAPGVLTGRGVLGELGLRLLLSEVLDADVAREAARGWGADRYVGWPSEGRTCIRTRILMDTARETAELLAALREYVAAREGASVTGTKPVVLTTCG
jgi:hypothetical protein